MSLRLFVESPLSADLELALPEDAARHVQVRRLQPGDELRLFDGAGGEWRARVTRMGKRDVDVHVDAHEAVDRELPFDLEIALGMPTNERMDALIEKATELGVAAIQPLQTERSVLRLDGDRAAKRVAHWQAVAVGASEQSGRTRVPVVAPVRGLAAWLARQADDAVPAGRFVMSTGSGAGPAPGRGGALRRAARPLARAERPRRRSRAGRGSGGRRARLHAHQPRLADPARRHGAPRVAGADGGAAARPAVKKPGASGKASSRPLRHTGSLRNHRARP